jgi:sugar phosphate isomerase/epimerase
MKTMKKLLTFYVLAVLMTIPVTVFAQQADSARYKIGVCDWMVLKRQKLGEFKLASELGCNGIELDMGPLGQRVLFDNKLRDPQEAAHFKHIADSLNIAIGAVAMSGFYAQDLTQRDNFMELMEDCFDTMDRMGNVQVAFLPLGGCGNDWATNRDKRREVMRRLHQIGERAKERGKVVGIDTQLDAQGNLKLLREVNSQGISIFYKLQTAVELGLDIPRDMHRLGARNICAIHASNTDGVWLRNDSLIDMAAIKQALDQMQWSGWMFVERSRDTSMVRNVKMNYGANVHFLRTTFQGSYPATAVALDSAGRPADYVQTIISRSQKVTNELSITWTPLGQTVLNIVCNHYFMLNDIYAERDSLRNVNRQLADAQAEQKLYRKHFAFDADLSLYLTPRQIETVKDVLTYNVVKVTYDAQCDMIPTLTDEEKAQILAWLKEARELAIDAESSRKKHEVFGRYKGRINNYLSRRGYDLTREREQWYERIRANGGQI